MTDRDRPWPLNLISGPTEESSPRDGTFSYSGEWHAFFVGVGVGFAAVLPVPGLWRFASRVVGIEADKRTAAMREARAESWYALAGVAIGAMLAVACMGAMLAFARSGVL